MSLKARINDDLKAALLSGNHFECEVLRGIKAVILNEEVAQGKRDDGIDDQTIEKLISKEVKKRNESATIYDNAGRPELSKDERSEAEIMAKYLPDQLSEDDIQLVVNRLISELGVSGMAAMGQVIGAVKQELGNSADGALIAKIVKNTLN